MGMSYKANKLKINPKEIRLCDLHKVAPSTTSQVIKSSSQQIADMVSKGFTPRWYVVYHLNRRLDNYAEELLEKDLWVNKDSLYRMICGCNWESKKYRPRSLWTLEWGQGGDRPHINLLIEDLSKYDYDYQSIDYLFNYRLPRKVRCVLRKSADVQPVRIDDANRLCRYVVDESKWDQTTINYQLTDWIK